MRDAHNRTFNSIDHYDDDDESVGIPFHEISILWHKVTALYIRMCDVIISWDK